MSQSDAKNLPLEHLDLHHPDLLQPKYERLKSYLVAEVTSGRLQPGDAMPTEKYLAETLKVARNTVRQAMGDMVRDGLILRIPGKGTFVNDAGVKTEDEQDEIPAGRSIPEITTVAAPHGLSQFALLTPEAQTAFYPALLDGFENASCKMHHQTLMGNSRNQPDTQARIILQLIDNQVAGVAMVPVDGRRTPPFHIRQLQQRGIPVVFCHRSV
ncbi:MAG: GntR family transcriptional regulator, partial [Planctomycetota bacterium]|nr:GntR family transcriptional regulator [Planctomycetota bacterium]